MTLGMRPKVLLHVWSCDFYDMTLSTEEQRRHVKNVNKITVHKYIEYREEEIK